MRNAHSAFIASIADARSQTGLYEYLSSRVQGPFIYDDILRFQIVFAVSAFDKLIHDLIRIGVVAIFSGSRAATPKYNSESVTIAMHKSLGAAVLPPPEVLFEQEIIRKLRVNSYQDPTKTAEGLSYIWLESNKWQKIASSMGFTQDDAVTRLKLIVTRRNAIVHEADVDPLTHAKNQINKSECSDIVNFIELCGTSIFNLVV